LIAFDNILFPILKHLNVCSKKLSNQTEAFVQKNKNKYWLVKSAIKFKAPNVRRSADL